MDGVGEPELEGVSATSGSAETIGADDGEPASARVTTWLRDRARDRARRHPLVTAAAGILVAALAVTASALALRQPEPPVLPPGTVLTLDAGPSDDPLWITDGQGRPAGPPVLTSTLGVIAPARTRIPLVVTGISGPGVLRDQGPPATAVTGATRLAAEIHPVLDCDRLPPASAAPAYRVRLLVGSGAVQAARSVPVPVAGGWVESAQQACRAWRARRDLTVTALSARVDPVSSRLVVDATVRNAGAEQALLAPAPSACCLAAVESGGPLPVPARSDASGRWSLWLPTCDTVSGSVGGAAPVAVDPLLSDQIGLAALAGPALPADLTAYTPPSGPFVEQLNPLGVVLARDAAAALTEALRRACGGLSSPVLLISPGSVRIDLAAHRLTVDAVLDVSPGLVRSVRLTSEVDDAGAQDFPPIWTRLGPLTPDRSGQVPLRLGYRITSRMPGCLEYHGGVPGFDITLEVPEGATIRTLHYRGVVAIEQDPSAVARFCATP